MSRVAKNPIVLPQGVEVTLGGDITVKGPLGSIRFDGNPSVRVEKEGQALVCKPVDGAANANALAAGTCSGRKTPWKVTSNGTPEQR